MSAATGPHAAEARRIYGEAIVIDMHNDLPSKVLEEAYDPAVRHPPEVGHTDVPRLIESGLTAVWLAAWVDAPFATGIPDRSYARAMEEIDVIHGLLSRHLEQLLPAISAADVRRAKQTGKVAVLIGVEGGHAIEGSLANLRTLYARGARYLTLTWNNGNAWAGSSIGSGGTRTGGLTPFGRQVIAELEQLGMLVDVSHVSDATLDDVLRVATRPVIASHSSARALAEHPRNLTDAQLRAIAATGGVVNVNFFARFIDVRFRKAMDAADGEVDALDLSGEARRRERTARYATIPRVPLAILLDHIDHVATVAGIEHVGLGSDFDGVSALPDRMDDVTALPLLAEGLLDRGYTADDVTRVLGGNMLRVMEQVLG